MTWQVEEPDFWSRVVRMPDGCWLWRGPQDQDGYGKVMYRAKHWKAHRLAWVFRHGEIPPGVFVCHTCDVPACCNPDHLWLGTNGDNLADRDLKGRHAESRKTHCPKGHEYTAGNTRYSSHGRKRHCRECGRLRYVEPLETLRGAKGE